MLEDHAIARYARQIIIPGVGAVGQEKLLATTVLLFGNRRGCDQAELYLRAAGLRVERGSNDNPSGEYDLALVANVAELSESARAYLLSHDRPICWYTADGEGFSAGEHPRATLPAASRGPATPINDAIHDVAACDAAGVACAISLEMPRREGPLRFELAPASSGIPNSGRGA